MERFVPKVKKYVSRLKNDKSTPSVPIDPPVDPPVIAQESARQDSPAPFDTTSPPQRIWNQAYDELKKPENEQAIVEAYEKILSTYLLPTTATTQDNNDPQNLINADPAKRWKQMEQLVQKGLERSAKYADRKEKVDRWITITKPLREAVSTGVKAAPDAAIPWAGICCALEVLSSPLTEPKKNRDGMTYVLSRMQWYWELWRSVLDENLSSSATRTLQAELEKEVATLYEKLLLFQMKSVITYHRSRFTVFLRDLPKLDDWATLVSEVKDAENSVMKDCEQYSTLEMRTKLRGILSSADEQANYLADMFNQNETHYTWVREERHKEKDDNCLRDLHKTDPRHDKRSIISAKGGLVYDSYRWVTENQQYKQWYEDRSNRLLWIKGDPGKGKTMLLCGIIDELEKSKPNAVFYFFCQASDPSLRSATYVLRGLIWSLARTRPSLIPHIRQQYDQAGADIFVNRNAWQALSEIFTAILSDDAAADCVFVVDALDECTDGQEQLIDLISRLSNACEARWIISSRNWQTIEGQLDSVAADARLQLELNTSAIAEAVHYFINHKVKELARGKRLTDDVRAKLNDYLVANADDTFLWVALVCEELSKLNVAARHILQVARSFPSGLTKLYERMMEIMKQSRDKKLCRAVLALSAAAIRPLMISEIAMLDGRLEDVSDDLEAITDIVRSCGSFLTIRDDAVHIVHQSARDYLIQASEIFPLGVAQQHYEIFFSSLNTMHRKLHRNMYQLESTVLIDEITPPEHQPLNGMQYAFIFWVHHLDFWYSVTNSSSDLDNSAHGLLLTFFTTKCLYWFEAMTLNGKHYISPFEIGIPVFSTKFATIKEDNATVLILDALTGEHLYSFRADAKGKIRSVSYHPDGRHLASLSGDGRIRIWNIDNQECVQWLESSKGGEPLKDRRRGTDHIYRLPFSTDGRLLAFSSGSRTIELWDFWEKVCLYTFYDSDEEIIWFDWGLDQSNTPLLLVMKTMGIFSYVQIDVWHYEAGQQRLKSAKIIGKFQAAVVGPDRRQLAMATREGVFIVWWHTEFKIRKVIERVHFGTFDVHDITWAADGKSLAIATEHCMLIWDLENQTELFHLHGYPDEFLTVRYGKDNRLATIGRRDNVLKIWSVELHSDLPAFAMDLSRISPRAIKQGSTEDLADFQGSKGFDVPRVISGNAHRSPLLFATQLVYFQIGPEHYFALLLLGGSIEIWDLASGDCTSKFQIYDDDLGVPDLIWPAAMALGTAGRIVSIGRQLKIWNLVTGTSLHIPHSFKIDQAVEIWNCDDGSMIQNYVVPEGTTIVGWDLQYQSRLDTQFGILDLEMEKVADCRGLELPWCPRSLRLAWTERSAWLMKGDKRVLWIPRGSVTKRLFYVKTDLETGMSTVAMAHSGHIMILRIPAEHS
ncbi:hypothetical protein HG530_001647 [Fusarium avenaceum]|nr:hypothetical protein HG530_001647 [Fusarium avenaceum]